MRIEDVTEFKAGTGSVLKVGDPVLVHFAIALNYADIEAEKGLESTYVDGRPVLARVGDNLKLSSLVSNHLVGRRARCTIRLKLALEQTPGLPRFVVVELWPDSVEADRLPVDRYELIGNFPISCDQIPIHETDSQWLRNIIINPIVRQDSGIIVNLSSADLTRLQTLLAVQPKEKAPVQPKRLEDSDQYLLHQELIDFLNKRHLWPIQ